MTLLPSPDAAVFNDGQSVEIHQERRAREKEKGYNGNGGGTPLAMAVKYLPTPMARDGKGPTGPGRDGGDDLPGTVTLLPTPQAVHNARCATANRTDPKPTTNTKGWTLEDVRYADRFGEFSAAIERHERLVTGRPAPAPIDETGRLAPEFVEWMMGLPEGWVTDTSAPRTAQLRMLGNGVVPQQALAALELLDPQAEPA